MSVLTFLMSFAASRKSGCAVPCCSALPLIESMSCLKFVSPVMKLSLRINYRLADAKECRLHVLARGSDDRHPT